ncbi:hypothetical protein GGI02_004092, partial [Coemansia sp. RSA 2322]
MTQVKAKAKAKTRQPMPSSDATDSAAAAVAAAADPASADADGVEADADLDSSTSMFKKTTRALATTQPRLAAGGTAVAHCTRRQPATSTTTPPKQSSHFQRPLAPPSTRIVAQQYQPPPVAFVPPPPSLGTSESSLTRIIELYGERTDLLRLVLSAKAEEDRARAEYERRVQEELRFETRRLDFEMLLHSNFFKQQERDQQLQQQLVLAPSIPPSHAHAVALHSPLGPPPPHYSHSQQQQQSTANGHAVTVPQPSYAMQPVVAAHEASGLRAYHHPDTPGGPDGRANQNPFAFFKLPPGAPLHHPSAYSEQQQQYTGQSSGGGMNSGGSGSSQMSSGGRPQPQQQQQQQQQQLSGGGSGPKARQQQQQPPPPSSVIRDRQPVMPAVSGLSVRILNHDRGLADAPRSAPVDGPGINKRPFSHEEVITALRRKVMGKGGVASVPVIAPRHVPPP